MASKLVPAASAAARAGIKRSTLYAYVSRGLLTAHARSGHRGSWFDPVELDALVRRARGPAERPPDLRITSAVTLIERGRYWYRGRAPETMAATQSFEVVAEWLWTGEDPSAPPAWPVDRDAALQASQAQDLLGDHASATDRVRVVVAVLGALDPLRFDLRPDGGLVTARRLVATTVWALARRRGGSIADQVASWVTPRRASPRLTRAIDMALTMMADHELAASTLAVRVAASFKADPYAAVVAGLGAMGGSWHGAASRRVEEAFGRVGRGQRPADVVARLLEDDNVVPGFGHPLYPDGDPRVPVFLTLARTFGPTPEADAVLEIAMAQGLPRPNADFALAALSHRLGLPVGAGEAIFTIGRLAGWLAHALEEYAERTPLRLRALYTGPRPE
jgi:citrate synthase